MRDGQTKKSFAPMAPVGKPTPVGSAGQFINGANAGLAKRLA
jgi:hypothetical protein